MYLQSLVAGAARVDLDGNPAGEVSAADAEHAAATLAGILASRETRRAAAVATNRTTRDHERAPSTASPTPLAAAPTAKVLTLKERPVLRLPAFRQQQKRG
jgi:sRNA-binding protein